MSRFSLVFFTLFLTLFIQCTFSSADKKDENDFIYLFSNGTLSGWEGDTAYWRIENGVVIGQTGLDKPELKTNTFLIWKEDQPENFELILEYRISEVGNSGINYRSEILEDRPYGMKGYQADIDGQNNYTGQNYEEMKRTTLGYRGERVIISSGQEGKSENNAWNIRKVLSAEDSGELKSNISPEWNELRILAYENKLQHFVNGFLMSEVIDNDSENFSAEGYIGFQIHTGPPMKVEYKRVRIRYL